MVLTNFSKYHWPSQRMVASLLTLAVAIVGLDWYGKVVPAHAITSAVIVISASWLFLDSLFHVMELVSTNGYKLVRVCKAADRARPVFLAFVAAGNILYAASLLTVVKVGITGIIFLHVAHAIVFMYILLVDWYIDNSNKLQKAKYKRG